MSEKTVPIERCEQAKKDIEASGRYEVVSCNPIPEDPHKCKLVYRFKTSE